MTDDTPMQVVCGLIFHGNRLLATRRDPKRHFPLLWEFPGGKLENGEMPEDALHRELEEELQLKVEIVQELPGVAYQGDGFRLKLLPFVCRIAQTAAPIPLDHVEIRWIEPEWADHLTWAPPDIPLIAQLNDLAPSIDHE
ncbi:MAG: (deoxy)nucleoside triphosphate pyrophosphohydrolase [Puniceicoccaceae bacterium]